MDDSSGEAPVLDAGDLVRFERPIDHAQLADPEAAPGGSAGERPVVGVRG